MRQRDRNDRGNWAYSERIDAALRFAAAAHHEDVRKGTRVPYVMHPFHVGLILDRHGFGEDVVIAGILHDVLEDPHYERDTVQERLSTIVPALRAAPRDGGAFRNAVVGHVRDTFGQVVLDLVAHVTEQKTDDAGVRRPWRVRKEEQLAALAHATDDVCAIKAADCLHNLYALTRDMRAQGPSVMERFNAAPGDIAWYHAQVAESVAARLGADGPLVTELREALETFQAAVR